MLRTYPVVPSATPDYCSYRHDNLLAPFHYMNWKAVQLHCVTWVTSGNIAVMCEVCGARTGATGRKWCSFACLAESKRIAAEAPPVQVRDTTHLLRDRNCYWCAAPFRGRAQKMYCSDGCKVAAHRAGKALPPKNGQGSEAVPPLLSLRFKVFHRDGFRCRYCGRSAADGVEMQADHVMPKSKGGEWSMENLVTACWECNIGKMDFILATRAP